ncbi:MAG: SDR family NAD(P)-dependent oxidoreductase [Solirubrobacteraceae bacterium]|nr:SDR family NAD(P)-dependent oxidoreductase [Patulibacter sp.]
MSESGKTAVVTGAPGAIGRQLVRRLAERGLNLVLVDVDGDALDAQVAELDLPADRVLTVAADVSREVDVQRYVDGAVDRFGTIDLFANNAGIESPSAVIEEQSVEVFDRVFAINVRGVFLGLQHVLPVMRRQGSGAILNTASLAGLLGSPTMAPYIMSKHAVIGLTRTAALEVAGVGIRVNAIAPGAIDSEMMTRIDDSTGDAGRTRSANLAATPMGRYGDPAEVAAVMNFLLSDEASYVTASIYTVDGGMLGQ